MREESKEIRKGKIYTGVRYHMCCWQQTVDCFFTDMDHDVVINVAWWFTSYTFGQWNEVMIELHEYNVMNNLCIVKSGRVG